jgi:hypothetical protein
MEDAKRTVIAKLKAQEWTHDEQTLVDDLIEGSTTSWPLY